MKLTKVLMFFALLFILQSCDKNTETTFNNLLANDDYLVFGSIIGWTATENFSVYKLTTDKLYRNNNGGNFDNADYAELNQSKFDDTKNLTENFPEDLSLEDDDSEFGCPNCADQGGFIVHLYKDGELKQWKIDSNKDAVPEYLHSFIDVIIEKIDNL